MMVSAGLRAAVRPTSFEPTAVDRSAIPGLPIARRAPINGTEDRKYTLTVLLLGMLCPHYGFTEI